MRKRLVEAKLDPASASELDGDVNKSRNTTCDCWDSSDVHDLYEAQKGDVRVSLSYVIGELEMLLAQTMGRVVPCCTGQVAGILVSPVVS